MLHNSSLWISPSAPSDKDQILTVDESLSTPTTTFDLGPSPAYTNKEKIAKESGILKLSVGGLANSLDSVDSVRSGVSRLFRLSNQIQEATCNGEFPSASNPDSIIGLYKKMVSEFYLSSPHEIFQYVRSTLPDKKDMYDVIRLEVLEAQG